MRIDEIFKKCEALTMSKRQDYTTNPDVNNHENFERSAELASWFTEKRDKPYAVLIGTKLARLGSLLSNKKDPKNESIEDSFLDLITYCGLWMERFTEPKGSSNLVPIDPNPHRNTACYFCGQPITETYKIISGKYKQAHRGCTIGKSLVDLHDFLSSDQGIT